MAASLLDLFRKTKAFTSTTTSSSVSDSATSFDVASASGWPTDTAVDIVIDRKNADGTANTSGREVKTVTVAGNTLSTDNDHGGLDGTTRQSHSAQAAVELNLTANAWNDMVDGILVEHNQDGTHNLPAGGAVQVAKTQTGAVATGTTIIPFDDTIPQKTEGDEYMTLAITPKSATNILVIEVAWYGSAAIAATDIVVALFQDDTADAIAATSQRLYVSTGRVTIPLKHTMTAGTTSAITFKVRAGATDAGTVTFNGSGGARKFGGVVASSIVITEYKA